MNTYETMKHNIPEGATHYRDDSSEFNFAWFNANKGEVLIDGLWVECTMSAYPAGFIKPIPQPTYRYEKVKTVFSLDRDLMHKGEYGEVNNDEFYPAFNEVELVSTLTKDKLYRRIEVTERELEIEEMTARLCGVAIPIEASKLASKLHELGFGLVNGKG